MYIFREYFDVFVWTQYRRLRLRHRRRNCHPIETRISRPCLREISSWFSTSVEWRVPRCSVFARQSDHLANDFFRRFRGSVRYCRAFLFVFCFYSFVSIFVLRSCHAEKSTATPQSHVIRPLKVNFSIVLCSLRRSFRIACVKFAMFALQCMIVGRLRRESINTKSWRVLVKQNHRLRVYWYCMIRQMWLCKYYYNVTLLKRIR